MDHLTREEFEELVAQVEQALTQQQIENVVEAVRRIKAMREPCPELPN